MANDKNLKGVYETLKREGYTPPEYDVFVKDMQDDKNLRGVHATLTKEGYTPPAYDQFKVDMFGEIAPVSSTPGDKPGAEAPAQDQTTRKEDPQPEAAPAERPQTAPQQGWQPTEQEKIQMSYRLNSMMSDFNRRSRARVEQSRRMIERYTPEGRKKLKTAKFQAQLAGTPTQVMGLTPDVSASPSGDGQGATGEQAKPLLSGQGPVPYGVVEVDGKRTTQWLLPDGTLTTDFMEADKAEYGARRVRLMNQFIGRMKSNGLDPANQEDVQQQAQLDMISSITSPLRREGVAESLWKEAEAQHKSDKDRNASKHWGDYAAMGGGREMRVVTTAMNRHDDLVSHMTRFDVQSMMDKAWSRVGDQLTENCYNQLRRNNPETPEAELRTTASEWARQLSDLEIYNYAVEQNAPKSTLEFFGRKVADANLINSVTKGLARMSAGTPGDLAAYQQAMEEYGKDHKGASIGGTVVGMAIDPTTWISGGMGSLAGKGAVNLGGRFLASGAAGMSAQVGERLFSSSLTGRILTGMAAGAANLGTFEAMKEGERQFMYGGYVNPETGEVEGYSLGAVLNSGVHGAMMGAATGVASPLIGNVADKAVKATTSTAGKIAMRGTEQLLSTVAEGTIFSIPEWISGDQDAFDVWTDNMAMMAGFKLSHTIKTAPAMIRSLQPVKPTGDRPLSREERIHNNKSFAERLRERLDQSPSDIAMTREEREELKRKGYGDLSNLFVYDPEHKSRKVNAAQQEEGDYTGVTGLSRAVDYEPTLDEAGNPTFDGYEAMERLMEDESVSEATRAKAYYLLTGRMLPMSTVTGWSREDNEDGTITITSHSNQRNIVTSRSFSSEKEAQREIDRIERQSELNTIDIGEQYRNAEAQQRVMDAAIKEVSPGADPQTVYNIYEAARRGDKNVTEEQHHLADMIDEAIERNSSAGDEVSPAGIRERISQETGVDIDKAIRKEPGKRTEAEQEAVKRYARELFPEPEAYEPTPEEAEADRVYEESRLLFGRFEQGDPEAQAEIDAISLRMTEAHQLCEDAFGDEAEVYMAEIKENPWGILNDPELTPDQKDAVLYYINANAALDGVLDASNEAASDKRQRVQGEVARRTHKERGVIVPATMKMDDKPVYIINGEVAMFPDGTGVDVRSSSESVIILDESGEYKFTSPDQIMSVGEAIDPQIELQTAFRDIDREQEAIISAATDGVPESSEIVLNSGETDEITAETAEETPQSVPNVEEYDRGYEEGTRIATILDDNILNTAIDSLQGREFLTDMWRGRLEAYEYEQQRRAMEGSQATPENISQEGNNAGQNIPENNPEEETAPSALERIPVDEQTGDPILTHESVDADTAWDAAIEFFGTPVDALSYVQAEVNNAKSAITTAEKAVSKVKPTGGMIKYRDELKAARDKVEAAKGTLAKWQAIEDVQKRRKAEEAARKAAEMAAKNAQLHDEAVARFEEEQRIKAEKQAEQERIGTHAVNPKIKEKWDVAPKVDGHPDIITLPDGSALSGHYVMTEAVAASASHDVNNAFEPTEGFPIDKHGQSVNDRDYKRDRDAQQIVQNMADAYDSRAMQTPVIVSKDGVVLSGNNRTMSGDIAATQGTDGAYLEYLSKYGRKFGFTPEQMEGMNHPRVVFVPDDDLPYDATTFSRFNAPEMKSQSKPEAAIKLGKIVDDAVFNRIVADLNRYDRLSDFYADQEAAARTLGELVAAGVVNDKQLPELRTGTALSAAGKELIENTLIGKIFQSEPDAVRMIISMPTLRQSVILGLNEIANNRTLSAKGYDLSNELSAAVDLVFRAKTSSPDIYKDGMPVSPFGRMQGLFDDEYGDSSVSDATTLLLADLLNSGKPSDVRKVLAMYNKSAGEAASGAIDLFSDTGEPDTKEEILTRVNELFDNGTAREKQKLVDDAIADRKQRAASESTDTRGSEAGNETADTGGRGESRQEREPDTGTATGLGGKASGGLSKKEIVESEERDENGRPFVLTDEGISSFGYIDEESGLTPAPIKLSEGFQDETTGQGYGLLHIEAGHGNQIRAAGFRSVKDFVSFVAKNYDRDNIRVGKRRPNGNGTFLIQVTDKHDNTLFIELSNDGSYWNVNSGGIFRKGYSNKKETVAKTEPQQPNNAVSGDSSLSADERSGISSAEPNGESSVSEGKGNALLSEKQETGGKSSLGERITEAEAVVNTEPTEAQKEAGNYRKGHVKVEGFDVTIEQPKGSVRRGKDANGNPWESKMNNTYGYIRGTEGVDGDHIDVFLSDTPEEGNVYVVDQYEPDGTFDEHKVMYGFPDVEAARSAYLSNYEKGWDKTRRIDVTGVTKEDFKKWIQSSRRKTKPFADYKSVKALTEEVDQKRTNINKEGIITDGDGQPLTLYHGTPNKEVTSVSMLEPGHKRVGEEAPARFNGDGVSFTPEMSVAQDYASEAGHGKGRIFPANIRLQNPYYTLGVANFTPEEAAEFTESLKAKGHDGIINYASASMREIGAAPNEVIVFDNSAILPIKENSLEEGWDYTITPTTYTNKKGKTSDVWLVKFDRDLSKEEKAALDTYTREPLAEGRKTSRGWYDRKEGGYMMRSEETAQKLAGIIGNDEAVADAQPLSVEDYKETLSKPEPSPEPPKKPTPMNRVDVEGLFNDLGTKGETRLSDHAEPISPEDKPAEAPREAEKPKGQFRVDDEMRDMEDELRSLLGIDDSEGDRSDLFRNPEDFTNKERMQITSLGITYALKYFDQGIVSFPDFADKMVRRMGEKIRPWLKAFYGGARDIPGYDHLPFTPADEVKAFDVMNFDKANKDTDPMRTAQGIVAESRAETAVNEAQREITEQRNQKRKERDEQTTAGTEAIAQQAELVASEAEATAESAVDEKSIAEASEKIDDALEKVNEQLAILGYYEAEQEDKDFNEAYGYMRNAEKKALADAVKLAKQLLKDLGIEIDKVTGATTAKKSKKPTAVTANIAPAGGDISIRLPLNEGRELYISIGLDPSVERGDVTYSGDNLQATRIMYRVETPSASGYDRFGRNCWAEADTSYSDLLKGIQRESYKFLPESSAEGGVEEATKAALDVLKGGKKPDNKGKSKKTEVKPEQTVGDLFSGLFDEPVNSNEQKKTDVRPRPGTGEREGGHEPRQDEPVGTSQRNEDGGTDGRGMAGRGGGDTLPDTGRGGSVSPIPSEHAVSQPKTNEPLTRLPQRQRRNRNNHMIKRGSEIAPSSVDARIRANIEAIETMKRLTSTGADATAEDMAKMRAFSGWGGLGKAFSDWTLSRRLRELLGEEAFAEDAQMSRNSAYFTPGYVVDAMWDVAKALGFRGGNVLEGSAGIGNIIGLMPPELSDRSIIQAVEKDTTTGSMLSLLYPDAKVDVQGFEETKIQNGSIDLAITNVPFVPGLRVKDTTGDADLSKRFKDIHNFCIAKNIRKLRDGGIGIFITTKGTLDSTGGLYNWLNNEGNADIVGLFRLHNETFGGTDATSDIIVVRKRVNGQRSEHAIDASSTTGVRTADYDDGKKTVTRSLSYNRYFVEHPEHMAGEMKFGFETGNTYRPTSVALHPAKGKDQGRMLKAWVKEMSEKTFEEPETITEPTNHREEYIPTYDNAGVEVKTGSMQVDSKGRVCVNYDGKLRPLMSKLDKKNPKGEEERIAQFNKNKVKGRTRPQVIADYNEIKKALNELLDYQKNNEGDEGLQPLIDNLNRAYDKFIGYYGHLHDNTSISWLRNDVDFPSVLALETYREEGLDHTPVFGKADIFRGRVMARMEQPKPQNIKDGVILSIRQTGDLNVDYIAEALGKPVDEVKKEIIEQGLGYENPTNHVMEPAHLYLSGNVREKLRLAEANNEKGRYDSNITALRRIVPPTVPSHMIEFSIGSSWLDPKLFNEYVKERTDLNVSLSYAAGTWTMQIDVDSIPEKDKSFGVQSDLCDKIIPGHELILAAMTNKTIRVSKTQKDDKTIFDPTATQVCASKVDEIRDDFRSWLRGRMQQDEKLASAIEEKFNDIFNNSAPMEIPNEYVPERFEGAATVVNGRPLKLRPHQSKAVVRGTMQSLMLAHEVGTGKTYTLITTAMEMRRLGTAKKPMIVVQNSTLGQFVASAKALYPDARILSLEDKDRNAQGRKDFYAKIRYNDWDMVVIPQSVLEKIDDHPDRKRKFIEDTIAEKLEVIDQLSDDRENGRMVANMKKEVEKLRDDLAELHAKEEKKKKKDEKKEAIKKANAKIKAQEMLERETDDNLNFDDLGIDAILVDEAHEYKHLGFATAMQRGVKGIDPSFSKKCQGLFLKVKAIQERSGGRNVVFATGTPISNTAAEIWTFMRYLMPKEEMEAYNIWYFDDFVRNFGSIQQMLEYGTSGTYKEVNRFAGYNNLPEMARLWAGITDTVKTDETGEVKKHIPALEGGQPNDIHLPQTSALRSVLKYVRQRLKDFEAMTGQEKKENSHIPLVMYGIAKAAAVDARLVSASAPDDPHSKTNEAVRQTLRSLKDTEKYNGTVAIFADNYQRKNKQTDKVEFNLFEDIKKKLIRSGVPESQIWIMNSGMSAKKKEEIFSRVNSGEIRVIMGTTPLLGVGVNIQERLHTLMHLDAPNRPMDYWQRMGRLLRQGNLHKEMNIPVRVLRFGVEDSLDVTAYQRLKTKGAIADAVMNSKALLSNNLENRVLEEEGDEFGQITAELSGSEYAILQNQTEKELRKLLAKEENHRQHQTYIYYKIPEYKRRIEATEAQIEALDEKIAMLEALPKEKTISINGKKYKGTASMEQLFKEDNKTLGELIERAENLGTESKHIVRFTIEGKLHGEIERTISQQMVSVHGDMGVVVDTYVTILGITTNAGITTRRQLKSRWLKANINEILELINPERFKRVREREANDLAAYHRNVETLSKDRGKPFEHTERIAELRQQLEEYTLKLQEDLAAKEKKYAEMDKEVADLDDINFTSEDDEEETEEVKKEKGRELSRLVSEGNSLDFLDAQGHRSAYRYAQFVPGGLTKYGTGYVREGVRPPMTAIDSETQDWRAPMEFNEWEQSVEGMRKDNGKADLVQGNGRTTGNVAYNPYFHIRVHPLNDQFSAAYDRPELVVVEGDYPESELTSGYRAEGAKNAVGLTDWHAGSVNGQLSPGKKVQTVLSRYFKPRRIVPWSEVAERIMDHIAGEDVTFPLNVVPPRLRAELSKRGAKFHGISGSVSKDQRAHLEDVERELATGNHDFGVEGGLSDSDIAKYNQRIDRLSSTDTNTMEGAVTLLSDKLNTPIRVISRQKAEAEGYRRKKGWYDRETGQITVVADNHRNVGDIADTAVHEAVGHHGLRQLFGTEEKLNNFLDEAYNISNDKIKAEINRRTERMMDDEVERLRETMRKEHEARGENPDDEYYADMAKARIEAEKQREQIRRDATEEYAADLGMKIGEEGFERMDAEELTFWGKIKGLLQKALDRLLAGLKLPKMRRWSDKEWSYVLWRSWRNLRDGERSFQSRHYEGPLAEAEDIVMREKSNYGASESRLFRDGDMGLEEAIAKMKADAAAANGADFKAKQDAMRAIGGNLSKLRQAMARQREYDITTVKSMTDLSKILLDAGLLDDLSKYETKRILSAIKDAVGREDTSKQVQRLMDIMVDNQLRMGANYFGKLLSVKGSRVDARGIEVQGELDPDGQKIAQTVRRATTRTLDDIESMMAEAINRMGSADQALADEAALEYAGLQIAHQYVEEIRESKNEEKELRESIREAESELKLGHMDKNSFRQYKAATEDAIRQNKIERAEAYRSLSERLGGVLGESVERAKAWREAEKRRVEDIHHNANSDMEGRPTNEHHKADRLQKFVNNGILRFVLAPLGTFDQMLRMFGRKSVRGEGYLWNRFMRGWVDCTEKEYTGYQEALTSLDKKVSEVFGKDMKWGDLFAMERRMPKASVRFWDGGEMRDHELTQGNLLYIYMADKMTDGRMKLRRMGITEADVERIKNFVDPRFIELADWMQEEFLTEKRNGYNEVHKRMFGASMAAIENYFPLKILANARMENVDVADDSPSDKPLPATSTGSIIKRKRNNLALDVTGADAFSVILDHIQQMERWAAFAEYNRDLNTLLSYKRFRNQVMNMTSAYGAGKTLWSNFRNVAAMAAGAYRPPIEYLDKAAVNVAKGVTAAKVSFRVFTALKQFLSMPAYLSDSNPVHLATNLINPVNAWNWSMENLPLFEKRWKSRMAGDPRLLKSDMDWKMWRSRIMEIAGRVGMSPNAFVDALTVAIGARSMYQTKLAKYKRYGYTPEQARKRALQDATILFNQTQQSSEGAFLSTMQVDRSWLSVLFTVFRNSSMSYTRQLYDAMRNLSRVAFKPGYNNLSVEFMAKQMVRDGIDPDKATDNAKMEYRRGIIRDLVRVGIFGFGLQLAWNLGAYLPYLIFGNDSDEKDKMWDDALNHAMFGSVEGLTGGDVISMTGHILTGGESYESSLEKDMPISSDLSKIGKEIYKYCKYHGEQGDLIMALNDVINLLVQSEFGFNPQTLTDAAVAVMDFCGEDANTARECALLISRILNCPQSQIDKIYFDEIEMTGEEVAAIPKDRLPEEIAERYAEYKLHRNAPLTGWAYDEEGRKKVMDKHRKNAKTAMKERINSSLARPRHAATLHGVLDGFDAEAEREKELNRIKKTDRAAWREGMRELYPDSVARMRHNRVKRYNHSIDRLTKRWLNAKTAQEADSIAKAMVNARDRLLSDLEGIEAQ